MVDSATVRLDIWDEVVHAIEDHVLSDVDREVGGILVGARGESHVRVEAAIPALKAVGERANVTFTHEVWDDVHAKIERDYPGKDIVGWYHSHPGFGIFLSGYDRFIHENFFSDPSMLALVVDPLAGQLGWFGWLGGKVALIEEASSRKAPAASSALSGGSSGQRNRRGTAVAVAGALIAASLGIGFWLGSGSNPAITSQGRSSALPDARVLALTNELQQMAAERDRLQASRERRQAAIQALRARGGGVVTIEYVVQPGDSLWRISATLMGSGSEYLSIAKANPWARDGIDPGDVLLIRVRSDSSGP